MVAVPMSSTLTAAVHQLLEHARRGMHVRLFNTEARQLEPLKTLRPGEVTLYTCGPTVYNFAHIGNFRTYVFEDLLRRSLEFFGYDVTQVMNLTDVDDKTIRGAVEKGCSLKQYCEPYIQAFFEDLKTLNIQPAAHYPAATDYIPGMIELIERLLKQGVAYKGADGSVYFSIEKFPRYGRLSHLEKRELQTGASNRVAADEYDKDNASDFVLWKAYDPERDGLIYWESPYGKGRPGWHLECSCMAMSLLGETVDIHVGGVDNMFPHHENEIAQSEAATGKTFVNHWMHSEHLLVDNRKMSKSAGNFYTLRDLLEKGYSGEEVRLALIGTHYRTQLNFSLSLLDASRASLQRVQAFIQRLHELPEGHHEAKDLPARLQDSLRDFAEALADDLNISVALAALYNLVREGNTLIDQGHLSAQDGQLVLAVLAEMNGVLGVFQLQPHQELVPADLEKMLAERIAARQAKDWKQADALRDAIAARGYMIEDSPTGARLKKST
jgi:cysteinyl-tRNA synthetase